MFAYIINLHFVSISDEIPLETVTAFAVNMHTLPQDTWPWRAYDGDFGTTAECTSPCYIALRLPRECNIAGLVVHIPTDNTNLNDNDWKLYLSSINNTETHIKLNGIEVKYCGNVVLSLGRTIEEQSYSMDCDILGNEAVFWKDNKGNGPNIGIAISEVKFFIKDSGNSGKFDISIISISYCIYQIRNPCKIVFG